MRQEKNISSFKSGLLCWYSLFPLQRAYLDLTKDWAKLICKYQIIGFTLPCQANICVLRINKRSTRKRCGVCPKLTVKTNLTLNIPHTFYSCLIVEFELINVCQIYLNGQFHVWAISRKIMIKLLSPVVSFSLNLLWFKVYVKTDQWNQVAAI